MVQVSTLSMTRPRQHTAAPRRRPRNAEATRDDVLNAALEEFAEKGVFGARVEEIAARSQSSKHMIYYYFGNKDGLYAAVLERAYRDFGVAEQGTDYEAREPLEALTALIGSTFDAHIKNPHVVRILMGENLDRGRHTSQIDHSLQRHLVLETTGRILARGVAAGTFRADIDALQLHMTMSALSFYFVANRYTCGRLFDLDLVDPAVVARRRAEVIETVLGRCRA